MKTTTSGTIQEHVKASATEFSDRELHDQYDAMLDDCYSLSSVGGPFAHMSASTVLREVDPVAYRCGFCDWLDGERDRVVEIDGGYYDRAEAEKAREEFISQLETKLDAAQDEGAADDVALRLAEASKFTL